jgi:hypothetical protein
MSHSKIAIASAIVFLNTIIITGKFSYTKADSEETIPNFPACSELIDNPGNHASYTEGWHQIVGGDLLWGSDDVYSIADGNYVQCYCPVEDNDGIQTDWWRTDQVLEGWFSENGSSWNLGDYHYLAQNQDFDCDSGDGSNGGEPTPTPTPTDSSVTPTPTESITPTPTPSDTNQAPTPTPTISQPTPTPTPNNNSAGTEDNRGGTSSSNGADDSQGQVSAISTDSSNDDSSSRNELDRVKVLAATGGSHDPGQLLMVAGSLMAGCGISLRKLSRQ